MEAQYGKSSFGFEENIVACASYLLVGPVIYLKEKHSNFVRFHALQSTLGYAALLVYWLIVKLVPFLFILSWSPGILALGFSAYMMLKAYDGEEYRLPLIGNLAYETVFETGEDILAEAEAKAKAKAEAKEQRKRNKG